MPAAPWSRVKNALADLLGSVPKRRKAGRRFLLSAEQLEPRLAPAAASPRLLASYGLLPLGFEPNDGQVRAYARDDVSSWKAAVTRRTCQ